MTLPKPIFYFLSVACICVVVIFLAFLVIKSPRRISFNGQIADYTAVKTNKNLVLLADALPSTARQVNYWVKPYSRVVHADFTIGQQEFLNWTVTQGWKPKEIDFTLVLRTCQRDHKLVSVKKGFSYTEQHSKSNNPEILLSDLEVVFDANESRCYYRFTKDM